MLKIHGGKTRKQKDKIKRTQKHRSRSYQSIMQQGMAPSSHRNKQLLYKTQCHLQLWLLTLTCFFMPPLHASSVCSVSQHLPPFCSCLSHTSTYLFLLSAVHISSNPACVSPHSYHLLTPSVYPASSMLPSAPETRCASVHFLPGCLYWMHTGSHCSQKSLKLGKHEANYAWPYYCWVSIQSASDD